MAKISGQELYVAQYDLSAVLYDLNFQMGCETHPDADWADTTSIIQAGLNTASASGNARYTTGASGTDTTLHGRLNAAAGPLSLVMGTTEGDKAFVIQSLLTQFATASGATGERHQVAFTTESGGDFFVGRVLVNGSKAATGNSAGLALGILAAGQRIYSALHVLSGTGTLDVLVESDVTGWTTPITRITHTQAAGATSEVLSLPGPVATDDLWRSKYTIATGPFDFIHIVGIMEGV